MSDPFVEELLKRWGVSQLLDRCREQEVDLEALRALREDLITELVPRIGPRCKFLGGWKKWKLLGAPAPNVGPPHVAAASSPAPSSPAEPTRSAADTEPLVTTRPSAAPAPVQRTASEAPLATPSQSGATLVSSDVKKEVNVFLEGRIIYDGSDASGSGWLVADGFISRKAHEGGHGTPRATVKSEPRGEELDAEVFHSDTDLTFEPEPRRGPRFQLRGRISLSAQDLVEVPSFMLADASSLHLDSVPTRTPMELEVPTQQYGEGVGLVGDPDLVGHGPGGRRVSSPAGSAPGPSVGHGAGLGTMPFRAGSAAAHHAAMSPDAPAPPRAKRSRHEKWDLEAMLNSSSKGKMVLSLYQQRSCLDGQARQILTDLIIAEELREDLNRRITSQRFQEIAEAIVELFPGENEDTYFSNDRSNGDRPGGKGKLTSKYYNTRRLLAKSGVITRGYNKDKRQSHQLNAMVALQSTPEEEEAAQLNSQWLQTLGWQMELSGEEEELALQRWRGCFKMRMLQVLSPGHQPTAYLDQYILLKTPLGDKLVKADFDLLFKEAGNRLMNEWPNFSQHIVSTMAEDHRKQLPLLDHVRRNLTTIEGKQVGALLLLPAMLPVTTCKGSGEGGELWRPTRQEAQDGFLLHVKNEQDLSMALERHWARMQLMGQPVSPLPVIVGQSLDSIETAIVVIDENTAFYVPNALYAVDLCFKCFHTLQVPYPPQAQNVWLFLQHALYQVATPTDRMSATVSSLLADFGYRPVPPVVSWDQVLLS